MLLLIIAGFLMPTVFAASPLCGRCTCRTPKNDDPYVDCSNTFIAYSYFYDNSSWINDNGIAYPIGVANFSATNLDDLKGKLAPSNLTTFDLSKNFIRTIEDGFFSQLQNMEVLILSHNQIDHLKPDAFKGIRTDGDNYPLRSLKTLKLDNNRLHTLDPDLFEHVEDRLEILDLSYNPFKVIDQQTVIAIGSIIYLKELYLGFADLKALPDHFMHTPMYMKVLDLSGNNFESVPLTLVDSHDLEVLYFNNNPIVNLTAENGFPNITTLKVLSMCDMIELENIEKWSLSGLGNLEELRICDNMRLANIDPAALTTTEVETEVWPPIKKLDLHNNKLTHLDLHLILHWERLEELDLSYNPWTCECENQWMVEELIPIYLKINEKLARELRCEAPVEMEGKTFYDEYAGKKSMRCLDLYGARPERDAVILVSVFAGLLLGGVMVLFIVFAYQRHWFGFFDSSPASYSRQFYSRTRSEEL